MVVLVCDNGKQEIIGAGETLWLIVPEPAKGRDFLENNHPYVNDLLVPVKVASW
jgi:hypothetical protein